MSELGIAVIGSGGIALANHLPGLALCPDTRVVALCDSSPEVLEKAAKQTGITNTYLNYQDALGRIDVGAVIIATPNYLHARIAIDAASVGKHVLCEKPIAMSFEQSLQMLAAAQKANVRHMAAFTYRFVPAMRYMAHLVKDGAIGQPYHFRAQRFQDWGTRGLGWRQVKQLAGSGELGDMLSHRIDYAHLLVGRITRLVAQTRRFVDVRDGAASDLDDWVGLLVEFEGAKDAPTPTGVLESTKLATGRGEGAQSQDYCEVNGSLGTLVYNLQTPHELLIGKKGGKSLERVKVPREFLVVPRSPRDPDAGDPLAVFRYDQDFEFVEAIREGRECRPSFKDGAAAQAVMDAAILSDKERRWVDVPQVA